MRRQDKASREWSTKDIAKDRAKDRVRVRARASKNVGSRRAVRFCPEAGGSESPPRARALATSTLLSSKHQQDRWRKEERRGEVVIDKFIKLIQYKPTASIPYKARKGRELGPCTYVSLPGSTPLGGLISNKVTIPLKPKAARRKLKRSSSIGKSMQSLPIYKYRQQHFFNQPYAKQVDKYGNRDNTQQCEGDTSCLLEDCKPQPATYNLSSPSQQTKKGPRQSKEMPWWLKSQPTYESCRMVASAGQAWRRGKEQPPFGSNIQRFEQVQEGGLGPGIYEKAGMKEKVDKLQRGWFRRESPPRPQQQTEQQVNEEEQVRLRMPRTKDHGSAVFQSKINRGNQERKDSLDPGKYRQDYFTIEGQLQKGADEVPLVKPAFLSSEERFKAQTRQPQTAEAEPSRPSQGDAKARGTIATRVAGFSSKALSRDGVREQSTFGLGARLEQVSAGNELGPCYYRPQEERGCEFNILFAPDLIQKVPIVRTRLTLKQEKK